MVNVEDNIAVNAAKKGDFDRVRDLILNGATNINQIVLASSISDTNTDILVSNLISMGVKDSYINFSAALLAENGNDKCLLYSKNHVHTALYACKTDQVEILKELINLGIEREDIKQIYFEAKKYNATKILDFLRDRYEEPLDVKLYEFDDNDNEI